MTPTRIRSLATGFLWRELVNVLPNHLAGDAMRLSSFDRHSSVLRDLNEELCERVLAWVEEQESTTWVERDQD